MDYAVYFKMIHKKSKFKQNDFKLKKKTNKLNMCFLLNTI